MKYREIKRAGGIKVSEISLGCEGFIKKDESGFRELFERALDHGINFIDMYTSDPNFRALMGRSLKGRRDKMYLQGHIGSAWVDGQYLRTRDLDIARRSFDDQLAALGTDYLDIGMIHYVDEQSDLDEIFNGAFIKYCEDLKREGRIRALGMSSHNPIVAQQAVETGLIDVLMFSVNAAYDMQPPTEDVEQLWADENYAHPLHNIAPERERLYELCEREGVAIDVMKAFGGGDMLSAELSPFGVAFTEYQCLEYCLTRPAVVAVMAGCHTVEQLGRLAAHYTASAADKDYSSVLTKMEKFTFKGNCMYCGHCAPCAVGIDIAQVNKFLNICVAQGDVPETIADHYRLLAHHAGECISCGRCEHNCPFSVSIMEKMVRAKELFGY